MNNVTIVRSDPGDLRGPGPRRGARPLADEPAAAPRALHRRHRAGLAGARAGRLRERQPRPRHLDLEGRRRPLHGPAGGRDPDEEARDELRARGPVAAPPVGGQLGDLRLGAREGAQGPEAEQAAAGRHRGAGARPRLRRAVREADRQEARLVHHQRRRLRRRLLEDEAVPAALARRLAAASRRRSCRKGVGEWNHYYVRGINGEIRLWVNGEEVSGGANCEPHSGYLCLESEGSPVEFKNIRIRELP